MISILKLPYKNKLLFAVVTFVLCVQRDLWCQLNTNDSAVFSVQLQEVCIQDSTAKKDAVFGFYRTNKLASTEDILARMQGVNLIKRGAYGLEPIVRNYANGQTNVTIDGMRMYGACTDKMDPVSIYVEPTNLQAIQVSHGAAGAQEGSTIGGQIGLKLKEPEFNCHSKLNGQFAQSFLTVNKGYNASLLLSQSLNKIAYRLSATYRVADDYKAGGHVLIPHSGYEKLNTSAALSFKLSEKQILKLDYLGDWGRNIGYPALPMDVGAATANIMSITHQLKFKDSYFTANELKMYVNDIYHEMDDTQRPESPMHMDMPGWSRTYGFYNELKRAADFKLRLDFHKAYTRADMTMYPAGEPIMYMQTLPENDLYDLGLAASYVLKIRSRQQINFNGRMDLYSQWALQGPGAEQWKVYGSDITLAKTDVLKNGNVAYVQKLTEKTKVQLSVGYSERIPTSNERYGFYLYNRQDQYDYIGNIQLTPEQSIQTEILVKQDFKKFNYSVNLFYHHVNNYIYAYQLEGYSQMTIGAKGLKTYENIQYAVNTGFELSANAQILEQLTYIGNVKYVYAFTYTGTPLALVPPLKLQHALRYTFHLFQFQLEHDYAMAQNRVNPDYGDVKTPSFNLFNIRASRNVAVKSTILQFSLACENMFDLNYREHLDIGQVPRFGRNFLINVNFIF